MYVSDQIRWQISSYHQRALLTEELHDACLHHFLYCIFMCFSLSDIRKPKNVKRKNHTINQNDDDGGGDIHVAVMAHNDK